MSAALSERKKLPYRIVGWHRTVVPALISGA